MRATGIRYNGSKEFGDGKPTERLLEDLCQIIVSKAAKAGFITNAHKLTGSAIKIGLHRSSFRINTDKLGHNARMGRYCKSPKGYKRTDVPTWDQRVEFNNLVNAVFDQFGFKANIKSGPFTVRDKVDGAWTESQWDNTDPYRGDQYNGLGECCSRIRNEAEMREDLDSDRLEAEYKAKMRPLRLEQAKARRAMLKLFNSCRKVVVAGFYNWPKPDKRNGKMLTHKQFEKMLSKLAPWQIRKIKAASIEATLNNIGSGDNVIPLRKEAV